MQIYLSNSGQDPIYAQITRQIKQQILSGALRQIGRASCRERV